MHSPEVPELTPNRGLCRKPILSHPHSIDSHMVIPLYFSAWQCPTWRHNMDSYNAPHLSHSYLINSCIAIPLYCTASQCPTWRHNRDSFNALHLSHTYLIAKRMVIPLFWQPDSAGPDTQQRRVLVFLHRDVRALPPLLHLRLPNPRLHLHSSARCSS